MNTQSELPLKKSITATRDNISAWYFNQRDIYETPQNVHQHLGGNLDSIRQAMARLFQYGYLDRQRHKGSNEYEYKAGKRIATVQKTYGKRLKSLANKRKLSPRVNYNATPPLVDVATPIAGGSRNIGLTMSIGGKLHLITINEAYSIYKDLMIFFNARGSHES